MATPHAPDPVADRLHQLQAAGMIPMTAAEILAGASQGGVPRPGFLRDHDDDGSVQAASNHIGLPV